MNPLGLTYERTERPWFIELHKYMYYIFINTSYILFLYKHTLLTVFHWDPEILEKPFHLCLSFMKIFVN